MTNEMSPAPVLPSAHSSPAKATVIYVCAALGGLIAAIADVVQKEEASAVAKLTSMSARHFGLTMQPLYVLALLVALAVALCMVFQPSDRRQSFGVGMAIIAVIMTVTPYKQPLTGLPTAEQMKSGGARARPIIELASNEELPNPDVYSSGGSGIGFPAPMFVLNVKNSSDEPAIIGVSVFMPSTGNEFYQKNLAAPGHTIQVPFSLNDVLPGSAFQYRIDVNGKALEAQQGVAQFGVTHASVEVGSERVVSEGVSGIGNDVIRTFEGKGPASIIEQFRKPFAW